MIRSVCLFCGSRDGMNPRFREEAATLGSLLARNGLALIYGGGHVGLMGTAADAALRAGGRVVGVIPQGLFDREVAHESLTELLVTDGMHSRKAKMETLSDAFVAMPGGFGTLDELCEIITWSQLGIHRKPVLLMNTDGFWDGFLKFIDAAVRDGFIPRDNLELFRVVATADEAVTMLTNWR